jgi:putative transcriptional regulator
MENNIDFFRIKHKRVAPREGRILIAEPGLLDHSFKRAIILLVEHNDQGTVGFVLNNLIDIKLTELIPNFPDFNTQISIGGPVSPNSFHFIHTLGDLIPDTKMISQGLYWGGDFEIVKALIELNKITPRQIRFFIGYSGWGNNQLEKEIKENSWVVSELDLIQIMATQSNLWGKVVHQMGPRYKPWTIYPLNPSLN